MRYLNVILVIMGLVIFSGCPTPRVGGGESIVDKGTCHYAAARVHVIGLTSIEADPEDKSSAVISVYVSLHDSFGSSIKGPGVFWFELYEYVPRAGDNRGKQRYPPREIDLSGAAENNKKWKDVLRAYHFSLETDIAPEVLRTYVLQVTCVTPVGNRLKYTFDLNEKRRIRIDF